MPDVYENRTDRPVQYERTVNLADVATMPRSGLVPSWISRISWGSVFAGVFVAVAVEIVLSALGIWAGFGLAKLTSIASIKSAASGIGVWIGISALIAFFIGGIVASRLSNSVTIRGGLWHALTLWGVGLVGMAGLSLVGYSGLLGFGLNTGGLLRAVSGSTSGVALTRTTSAAATYAGYYVIFAVLGLGAALLGGWLGSAVLGRRVAAMAPTEETVTDEELRARRAA